ncbi:MAG: DUF4202 family protein [Candidatus Uhrbacteria bacterium]
MPSFKKDEITLEDKEKIFGKIRNVFLNSHVHIFEVEHGKNVLKYVLELNPKAALELQIAALAHDIDRGYEREKRPTREDFPNDYDAYKAVHAKRSAEIIVKLLEEVGFLQKSFINRVSYLVANHEVGGDQDANDLRDADSLAFIKDSMGPSGFMSISTKQQTKDKLDWMFFRMSEKNKEVVRPFYEDCKNKIEEYYTVKQI